MASCQKFPSLNPSASLRNSVQLICTKWTVHFSVLWLGRDRSGVRYWCRPARSQDLANHNALKWTVHSQNTTPVPQVRRNSLLTSPKRARQHWKTSWWHNAFIRRFRKKKKKRKRSFTIVQTCIVMPLHVFFWHFFSSLLLKCTNIFHISSMRCEDIFIIYIYNYYVYYLHTRGRSGNVGSTLLP